MTCKKIICKVCNKNKIITIEKTLSEPLEKLVLDTPETIAVKKELTLQERLEKLWNKDENIKEISKTPETKEISKTPETISYSTSVNDTDEKKLILHKDYIKQIELGVGRKLTKLEIDMCDKLYISINKDTTEEEAKKIGHKELELYWGRKLSNEEIRRFDQEYEKLKNNFEIQTQKKEEKQQELSINIPIEPIPLEQPLIDEDTSIKEKEELIFVPTLSKEEIDEYEIFIKENIANKPFNSEEEFDKFNEIKFLLSFYGMIKHEPAIIEDYFDKIKKIKSKKVPESYLGELDNYLNTTSRYFNTNSARIIQELSLSKTKTMKAATEKYIRALISNFKKLVEKSNLEIKQTKELKIINKKEKLKSLLNEWGLLSEKTQNALLSKVGDDDLKAPELETEEGKNKLTLYLKDCIYYIEKKLRAVPAPLNLKKEKSKEISPNKKYYDNLNKNIKKQISSKSFQNEQNDFDIENLVIKNKDIPNLIDKEDKDLFPGQKGMYEQLQLALFTEEELEIKKKVNSDKIQTIEKQASQILSSKLTNEIINKVREAKKYIEKFEKALFDASEYIEKIKSNIGLLKFNNDISDNLIKAHIELEKAENDFNELYEMKKEAYRLLKEEKIEPIEIKDLVEEDLKYLMVDSLNKNSYKLSLNKKEINSLSNLKNNIINFSSLEPTFNDVFFTFQGKQIKVEDLENRLIFVLENLNINNKDMFIIIDNEHIKFTIENKILNDELPIINNDSKSLNIYSYTTDGFNIPIKDLKNISSKEEFITLLSNAIRKIFNIVIFNITEEQKIIKAFDDAKVIDLF